MIAQPGYDCGLVNSAALRYSFPPLNRFMSVAIPFQVLTLRDEDERMAMEFSIACGPEDRPIIPGAGGFRRARWARQGKGKSGGFRVVYFFWLRRGGFTWLRFTPNRERRHLRQRIGTCSQRLAAEIKKAAKGGR